MIAQADADARLLSKADANLTDAKNFVCGLAHTQKLDRAISLAALS